MKRTFALLLAACLAIGVAGCGSTQGGDAQGTSGSVSGGSSDGGSADTGNGSSKSESGMKLGFCIPAQDQFFSALVDSAEETANELGMEIQTVEAKDDIATQIAQIETFKNNGYTSVAVALVSTESYQEAIDAAGDMNVIFFNRIPSDTSCLDGEKTMYVGMPEIEAGRAQGDWLADYFKDTGKTELKGVLFMGILGHPAVIYRTQGAKEALADAGYDVEWVFEDTAEMDRIKAMEKFTQFLGSGQEFDFVCSNNDEMAIGVIEACNTAGREIDFPIVGVDGTEVACEAILNGTMSASVNQDPVGMGKTTVECVYDMENGELPEGTNDEFIKYTEVEPVTKDNAEEVKASFN